MNWINGGVLGMRAGPYYVHGQIHVFINRIKKPEPTPSNACTLSLSLGTSASAGIVPHPTGSRWPTYGCHTGLLSVQARSDAC